MPKYKVPTKGSGTVDDPLRLKYNIKIKVSKNSVEPMVTYTLNGYAIVESKDKIPVLEKAKDVEKV